MNAQPPVRRVLLVEEAGDAGGAVASLETLFGDDERSDRYRFSVVLGGEGRAAERLRRRGVDLRIVPVQGWRWFEGRGTALKLIASLPLQAASLARWIRLLRHMRPDLVHLNSNRLVEPILAARYLRIPVIVHFRDIPGRMSTPFVGGAASFYWLMNRARRWIANSTATANDIRSHARVPVTAIPNGLDLIEFDRLAKDAPPRASSDLHVAMVALINPWKRHDWFLDLAERISAARSGVRFSIAGGGRGAYVHELRAACAARGLDRVVTFTGHIENVPAFLRSVDVLAHTTDPEPFGRVFLEAMAARVPVATFRSGGAAEVVEDGVTGVLVAPGDVAALAAAVGTLLDDAGLRERMGHAGRRRVEEHYTAGHYRAQVLREYDAVFA